MKKAVLVVIIISAIIAGGVLFAGFLNNQEEPSGPSSQTPTSDPISQPATDPEGQSPINTFTAAEVAQHSTPDNCWIIIENSVYNVTNFLNQHPGGADRITPFCGQDATQGFVTQGGEGTHSTTAHQLREDLLIGTLSN